MKRVFADADYLIALLNPGEQLHEKAKAVSQALGPIRIVTSEMVLAEVMAFYADKGAKLRAAASEVVLRFGGDPNATVIPQTSIQFREALSFYRQHKDKAWSLTDCASFLIMRETGLTDALSYDHHFEQAGVSSTTANRLTSATQPTPSPPIRRRDSQSSLVSPEFTPCLGDML